MDIETIIDQLEPIHEKDDFTQYCKFMMGFIQDKPDIVIKDYFRDLYKTVEMIYEEQILEKTYKI
jgi:hypothetical protein